MKSVEFLEKIVSEAIDPLHHCFDLLMFSETIMRPDSVFYDFSQICVLFNRAVINNIDRIGKVVIRVFAINAPSENVEFFVRQILQSSNAVLFCHGIHFCMEAEVCIALDIVVVGKGHFTSTLSVHFVSGRTADTRYLIFQIILVLEVVDHPFDHIWIICVFIKPSDITGFNNDETLSSLLKLC